MKYYFSFLIVITILVSCKDIEKHDIIKPNFKGIVKDTNPLKNRTEYEKVIRLNKKNIKNIYDFKKLLTIIKGVKHTGKQYHDWFSIHQDILTTILGLNYKYFEANSTSYTYKSKVVFYVHTIKYINDTVSIKPFLENAQGKKPEGYLQMRDLIFAMKDDKIANFIDIPEKGNSYELRKELLKILYKNIDSDIILCNRTKKCIYKDLRKNKIKGN